MRYHAHLTDEELINNVDMDMYASPREKELTMRLAMRIDAELDAEPVKQEAEAA